MGSVTNPTWDFVLNGINWWRKEKKKILQCLTLKINSFFLTPADAVLSLIFKQAKQVSTRWLQLTQLYLYSQILSTELSFSSVIQDWCRKYLLFIYLLYWEKGDIGVSSGASSLLGDSKSGHTVNSVTHSLVYSNPTLASWALLFYQWVILCSQMTTLPRQGRLDKTSNRGKPMVLQLNSENVSN